MAHCCRAGHHTEPITAEGIHQLYTWKGMETVHSFCSSCVLCATDGPHRILRPYPHLCMPYTPMVNHIHFVYIYIDGIVERGYEYVLLVKETFLTYVGWCPASALVARVLRIPWSGGSKAMVSDLFRTLTKAVILRLA